MSDLSVRCGYFVPCKKPATKFFASTKGDGDLNARCEGHAPRHIEISDMEVSRNEWIVRKVLES